MIRQLYTELRTKILQREWKGGDKLPSTRKLAEELCVSRNVVVEELLLYGIRSVTAFAKNYEQEFVEELLAVLSKLDLG